jgi:hypothetical protein
VGGIEGVSAEREGVKERVKERSGGRSKFKRKRGQGRTGD